MLAIIDQAQIDAPGFPRSQQWWSQWVPGYITAEVRDDGTVVLDVTGVAHPSQGRRPERLVRRNQELAFLRWFRSHRPLEAVIVEEDGERCPCWNGPCIPHERHCCFRTASVCHKLPQAA